jgi:peptide/nickel transport system ATP-binding protein
VMERAGRRELFYDHHHPYTAGLLRSVPTFGDPAEALESGTPGSGERASPRRRLASIPGQPPSLIGLGPACPFGPRCIYRMGRCRTERPPLDPVEGSATHLCACWLGREGADAAGAGGQPA